MAKSLLHGVGRNDADYPVNKYAIVDGKNKRLWICPIYMTWANMITRCYSVACQERHPTYKGCTVFDGWFYFSEFSQWMKSQKWQGMELDKDIIKPGNKVYSPEYCAFIDQPLNGFTTDRGNGRGKWPIGVSWEERGGKFKSSCSNPFTMRLENLGRYSTPEAAHEAWRCRKHQHACKYAEMQTDKRISDALRVRYLLVNGDKNATP